MLCNMFIFTNFNNTLIYMTTSGLQLYYSFNIYQRGDTHVYLNIIY